MKYILTLTAAFAVAHTSTAAFFADQVISYTPGTGVGSYTNTQTALGEPSPIIAPRTPYAQVFNPFVPPFDSSDLVAIGLGGQLTLKLSRFVIIDRTPGVREIGIWENVGLAEGDYTDAVVQTGTPATVFGADSAVVEVSEDNVTWYSLNNGAPITFTLPGNYYTNAGPLDSKAPDNPQYADFGKPFTGSLADFSGKTASEVLGILDGSAGGTWLDLDSVPLTQVGYIRFRDVVQLPNTSETETLEIDAVAINTSLAGSAVPEPGAGMLAILGVGMIGILRRKRA